MRRFLAVSWGSPGAYSLVGAGALLLLATILLVVMWWTWRRANKTIEKQPVTKEPSRVETLPPKRHTTSVHVHVEDPALDETGSIDDNWSYSVVRSFAQVTSKVLSKTHNTGPRTRDRDSRRRLHVPWPGPHDI